MGFSFRRMFRHPFGKHSLFAKATQVATILPIPGAGLISKAASLANRGTAALDRLKGAFGVTAGRAQGLPLTAAMPGGAPVHGKPAVHRAHKARRRAGRSRSRRRRR